MRGMLCVITVTVVVILSYFTYLGVDHKGRYDRAKEWCEGQGYTFLNDQRNRWQCITGSVEIPDDV